MAKRLHNFTESTYQDGKPTIDRAAGVIRNVKILGSTSKNGRDYSPQAMKEAAAIYEGLGVNTNHPSRSQPNVSRTVEEGVGWLENVTVKPDGVYGDFNVIKSHPLAETVFEVAERKPDRFGLSHNAAGECVQRQGRTIVESIKSVRSVDLVQNPATNKSLFESEEPVADRTLKDVLETMKAGANKSRVIELMEMDGMPFDPAMPVPAMGAEGEAEAEGDPFDEVILAGLIAIWKDPSLDLDGKKAKIAQLLDISGKLTDAPAEGEAPPEGEKPVAESEILKRLEKAEAELQEARDEKTCRALLESKKLEVTDKRLKLLKAVAPATRQDLIEEWETLPKSKATVARPAASKPVALVESQDTEGYERPKGAKALVAAYK